MNLATAGDHVNSMGLCNDGYNYSQHMRVMGGGVFVGTSGKVVSQQKPPATSSTIELPRDVLPSEGEIDRHLESITISEKVMDADMRAIVGGWDEEFEELNDDFVIQAAEGGDVEEFDYDAHIARLMAESERAEGIGQWTADENEIDWEECDAEEVEMPQDGERSLLEVQFEATLADYDGEEDDWREGLGIEEGDINSNLCNHPEWKLEDNAYVEQCLNEFLEVDDKRGKLLEIDKETMDVTKKQAMTFSTGNDETTTNQDEWKLMEKSFGYLRPREHHNWDCESILSTCTTTDNLPTTISVRGRGGNGNGANTMIRLSKKTGLPVHEPKMNDALVYQHHLAPNDELNENVDVCNNKGKARQRGESTEDRRARKLATKEHQRMRRKEKLALKNAFKEGAKAAQQQLANSESASARSVYIYS